MIEYCFLTLTTPVRESGHDTTYRFEGKCAHLATIDLNSLLFKYETDIFTMLSADFDGRIKLHVRKGRDDMYLESFRHWHMKLMDKGVAKMIGEHGGWECFWAKGIKVFDKDLDLEYKDDSPGFVEEGQVCRYADHPFDDSIFVVYLSANLFSQMLERRKVLVDKYLWAPEEQLFYDYDCFLKERTVYETATCLWALWSGIATPEQAEAMVPKALSLFEVTGGLVSGTEASRGRISMDRPNRQWDYPFGWAPHQMMAWVGLEKYGFVVESRRIAYRWLYTLTKSFFDFNGVVPEKFDVVNLTHKVDVEYGNVGADFKFVVKEGFGWMNASYAVGFSILIACIDVKETHACICQVGLIFMTKSMRAALGMLTPPDRFFTKHSKD